VGGKKIATKIGQSFASKAFQVQRSGLPLSQVGSFTEGNSLLGALTPQ
jgi:hypothetical protein